MPLKQSSPGACFHVKLPPVKWMHFIVLESQSLGMDTYWSAWSYTWKAILLASGIPHDGSTGPARCLMSKYEDHALAVLLRTTIMLDYVEHPDVISCITGKSLFSWLLTRWADADVIEIVYPSQLTKEEAVKFSVRGKPLEVIEYEVIEHEVETETEN